MDATTAAYAPDPRVHIGLAEGVITFDIISEDKVVFSFSMDEGDLYDAITNVEHLQPCAIVQFCLATSDQARFA